MDSSPGPNINYTCVTEINSCYYGLSLMRMLTWDTYKVCFIKGVETCIENRIAVTIDSLWFEDFQTSLLFLFPNFKLWLQKKKTKKQKNRTPYLSFICKNRAASKHCKWLHVIALVTKYMIVWWSIKSDCCILSCLIQAWKEIILISAKLWCG